MKKTQTFWTFLLVLSLAVPVLMTSQVSEVSAQQRTTTTTTTTTRRGAPAQRAQRTTNRNTNRNSNHTNQRTVVRHSGPAVQTRTYIRYHRGPTHVRHRYYQHNTHTRHVHHHHDHPAERQVIVVEVVRQQMPPIACPIRTESFQNDSEQWCATRRGTMHGPYLRWHENGHIAIEGNYAYGSKDGIWTEWHSNGEPRVEGEYVDGERIGIWVRWTTRGEESSVIDYGR